MSAKKKETPLTAGLSKENWDKWSNTQRRDWMANFVHRLLEKGSDTHYSKFGFTEVEMRRMEADLAELEKLAAAEQASLN